MDRDNAQFFEMIQKQKETLKNAYKRRGEIPPDRPTKQVLVQEFTWSSAMRSFRALSIQHNLRASFIPPAYAPCTRPLAELEKIMIKELRLEVNHRGRFLLARVLSPPDRMTSIMAVVEDEEEEAALLQLYYQEDEKARPAVEVLNKGMVIVVKEPYFKQTAGGGYGLRVDHVSDVLWLKDGDGEVPRQWGPKVMELDKLAMEWKEEGNSAVKLNQYWRAISCYSSGLQSSDALAENEIIRRNRAYAYLQTQHFDLVLSDLSYPFDVPSAQPEKTLFRAAKALHALGRTRESSGLWTILCKEYITNAAAQTELTKVITRLLEEERGIYDFKTMEKMAEKMWPPQLDHATYRKPVEARASQGRGRGLFLTQDVRAGDLLLCEKAFACSFAPRKEGASKNGSTLGILFNTETNYIRMGTQADLLVSIVQKLFKNPSLAPAFTDLHHGTYETVPLQRVDDIPVVDSFLIERIIESNAFGCGPSSLAAHLSMTAMLDGGIDPKTRNDPNDGFGSGIWIIASYINHSCLSNCCRSFIGDMQIIRATRDMVAGTELEFSYINSSVPNADYDTRQKKLREQWNFTCWCILCMDAKTVDKKLVAERKALEKDLTRAFEAGDCKNGLDISKLDTAKIKRTLAALENSYKETLGKVPRTGMWGPYLGLTRVYTLLGNHTRVLWGVSKTLEMLAFKVKGVSSSHEPLVVEKWGMVVGHLIECWLVLWTCFAGLGKKEKAAAAKDIAVVTFRIVVGEDETFEDTYGSKGELCIAQGRIWNGL